MVGTAAASVPPPERRAEKLVLGKAAAKEA
jgi:hypothetical protein